jgi:two-component sensor histidine kinase
MQTYQIDPRQIILKTDVKDVHLDINQGVPVGLLINELVSNALKHAFPKGKKGEILLKFYTDKKGKKTLIVSDNGIDFPEKVNISKPETLGMQLIKDLTKQIGGKLGLDTNAGTAFKITFS